MANLINCYYFAAVLSIVSCTATGLFVYLRKPNPKNLLFLLFNVNISAWAGCIFMVITSWQDVRQITFWIRSASAVAVFIPSVFYHFALHVGQDARTRHRSVLTCYAISAGLAVISFLPPFIRESTALPPEPGQHFGVPMVSYGPLFLASALYVVGALGSSIVYLWKKRNRSSGIKKLECEYILLSITVAFILTLITVFLMPLLGRSYFSPLAGFAGALISGIIAYGIARHRILEVSFLLRRTTIYVLAAVILGLIYSLVVLLGNWLFHHLMIGGSPIPQMAAAICVAFVFGPVKERLDRLIERITFSKRYQPGQVLAEIGELLSYQPNLAQMLGRSLEKLASVLNVDQAAVILRERNAGTFARGPVIGLAEDQMGLLEHLLPAHPLLTQLRLGDIIVREETDRLPYHPDQQAIVSLMEAAGIETAVPLPLREELLGFLVFGRKHTRKPFTAADRGLLQTVAGQLSIVISNAELFTRLQRAERLVAVGTLAAGMAHEIRNPLVSIKTFIQLLPEKFNDSDFRTTFTNIAGQEVDRINNLLEELLNFARPTPVRKQPVEIIRVLEQMSFLLSNELTENRVVLHREYRVPEAFVEGDEAQLQRVFSNLLRNSVQSMDRGGTATVSVEPTGENRFLQISISDTGGGIAPENIPHVFDPFFSTKVKGTGLGLAIVHSIVKEHGGSITVQSTPGKGTTFTVVLPALNHPGSEKEPT